MLFDVFQKEVKPKDRFPVWILDSFSTAVAWLLSLVELFIEDGRYGDVDDDSAQSKSEEL
jgi:hypothetical protein